MSKEQTKMALLLASGELFATRGFQGTSIRDIVKKAETSLSSVNYHFGNKEQLYLESIRYVFLEKLMLESLLKNVVDPPPFLRKSCPTPYMNTFTG